MLRHQGKRVVMDLEGRGLRAQLRAANKLQAATAYILGEDELARGIIVGKDMRTGEQREIPLTDLLPA